MIHEYHQFFSSSAAGASSAQERSTACGSSTQEPHVKERNRLADLPRASLASVRSARSPVKSRYKGSSRSSQGSTDYSRTDSMASEDVVGQTADNPDGANSGANDDTLATAPSSATLSSSKTLGKYGLIQAKQQSTKMLMKGAQSGYRAVLAKYVLTNRFDYFIATIVLLNTLLIGAQIHHEAVSTSNEVIFDILEYMCAGIFFLELMLRFVCLGGNYCNKDERYWASFDVFLVVLSCVDIVMNVVWGGAEDLPGPGASSGKILKMIRMARVMRVLRMVRFLGELRVMVRMIIQSTFSLFWLLVLLATLMYVFAILLTQGATTYLTTPPEGGVIGDEPSNAKAVRDAYGSLFLSMYTLFKAMTDGMSWHIAADALESVGFFYFVLFLGYIFFTLFSVLNIVTGVFVDGAIQLANEDRSLLIKKETCARVAQASHLMDLLAEMDTDESGTITLSEFEASMRDPKIEQFMAALQVDHTQAQELFNLLDTDGSGSIDIDEFVEGMQRIRGEAKSLDIHLLRNGVRMMHRTLYDLIDCIRSELLQQPGASLQVGTAESSAEQNDEALNENRSNGSNRTGGGPANKLRRKPSAMALASS